MNTRTGEPGLEDLALSQDLAQVKSSMLKAVADVPEAFGDLLRDQVAHTGKLLRPQLFLGAYRMFHVGAGPDLLLPESAYRAAASLELLHMATLLHDDILDEADLRRGRKTVFALQGAKRAVLAGDLLLTCALSLSADLIPPEEARPLSSGLLGICKGEVLQLRRQDPWRPSIRLYRRQIGAKTALLFSLSCRAGAQTAGASLEEALKLQRAGYQAGMAFQIVDDLFDLMPREHASGKTPSRDIQAGLVTAPVLAALQAGKTQDVRQQERLRKLLAGNLGKGRTPRRITRKASDLVGGLGGFEAAAAWADAYTQRSLEVLEAFPETMGRHRLLRIFGNLNRRQS